MTITDLKTQIEALDHVTGSSIARVYDGPGDGTVWPLSHLTLQHRDRAAAEEYIRALARASGEYETGSTVVIEFVDGPRRVVTL